MKQVEMMREKGYVTCAVAAEKAGVSVFSIYRWVEDKKVTSVSVGRHLYVQYDSLLTYLGPDAAKALDLVGPRGGERPV